MNVSRRWFVGGAASLGAFQGCRFVENPFGRSGIARFKFGDSFTLSVPDGDLSAEGEFYFAVTPLNCFGKAGAPLRTEYLSRPTGKS